MKAKEIKKIAKKWFDSKTDTIPVPTSLWMESEDLQISCFIDGVKSSEIINDEYAISYAEWYLDLWNKNDLSFDNNSPIQLLEIFKKEKGL